MDEIVVGTCGYSYWDPPEGYQERYESKLHAFSERFPAVEINRTFYSLPRVETAERWRREAADDFEFAVKGWQGLTHAASSPTWNDRRDELPDDATDEVGDLQPSAFVLDAWERTRERAEALDARVVLLQTPPSFDASDAHERNVREFAAEIDRGDLAVAWEPRGDWLDEPDRVRELCADCRLVPVVDPFRVAPDDVLPERERLAAAGDEVPDAMDLAYLRLHGRNEDPYDYDYSYADDELAELAEQLRDLAGRRDRVYCMFNNYDMYDDALALLHLLDQ